jgi:type II restriction enzyme
VEIKTEVTRIEAIIERLNRLRAGQLTAIEAAIASFEIPVQIWVNPESDLVNAEFAETMADVLLAHHATSLEPFTKDKSEYALVRISTDLGRDAAKSPRTYPGDDITIDGVRYSVKTQADSGIDETALHISKFMELGKGAWENEADLGALRDRMLAHMEHYERILDVRCLSMNKRIYRPGFFKYELVEIPKALLAKARDAEIEMMWSSKQNPRPGYGRVYDSNGRQLFELYFDGGTERKLQIRKLLKSECVVHAMWEWTQPA